MRIITHSGQAHADDFISVAVLLFKFPHAEVHRVSKVQEVHNDDIVVDIGERFDNEQFFDHHQDPNLPSALILVLKRFFPEIDIENIEEVQWISDRDTLGIIKAQEKWGAKLLPFGDPIAETVLKMFSERDIIKPGDFLHAFMIEFGKVFIKFLREYSENIQKVRKAEVFMIKGLKVVKTDVQIRFVKKVHPDVAVVVQPNVRIKGAMTLIRVDDHPRVDFRRTINKIPAHFVHNNGFLAVVDPEHVKDALELAIF